jgi:hypothetical protein
MSRDEVPLAFGSSIDSLDAGSGFSASAGSSRALLVGGTGFFVLTSEKLIPDFGCDGVVSFLGGGIFCSVFGPSSSTRKSLDGRKGLSSSSTDADATEAPCGVVVGCVAVVVEGRGASVAGRPPRVPDAGVQERFEN